MGEMGECDSGECGVKNHVFDEGGGAAGVENWGSFSLFKSASYTNTTLHFLNFWFYIVP